MENDHDTTLVTLVTAPDIPTARGIARDLVEHRLAACCNLVPAIESIYRWEEEVEEGTECLMIVKTTAARFVELRDRIVRPHPYDVPEVLALPVSQGLDSYLTWVGDAVSSIAPRRS